jgi:hypothetical protein
MTSELKCLYEKLGVNMFDVEQVTKFDEALNVPHLRERILETEFDKCDPCKVTFTVFVQLPRVTLVSPAVDICPEDEVPDVRVLPVEYRIVTGGHLRSLEMNVFTVYPLAEDCVSAGFETECYSYEICRVPCCDENSGEISSCSSPAEPNYFRVTFPLSREVACLIPEFGLSGFYLKNLVSTSLKTKVRLCPGNFVPEKGSGQIPAGVLSYDPERCEACLEVCATQGEYECITEGYEHLFNFPPNNDPDVPTIEDMALTRRYDVKGVSKCTEKSLLSFELCYKAPLSRNPDDYMNYRITSEVDGDYCFEFKSKAEVQFS